MYNRNYDGFDFVRIHSQLLTIVHNPKFSVYLPVTDGYTKPLPAIKPKMEQEIKKISYNNKPDFVLGLCETKEYKFNCLECNKDLKIVIDKSVIECVKGFLNIKKEEYEYLKDHYKIGLQNKSHNGGFPVFKKEICDKCNTEYYVYIGINEPRNSVYTIHIESLMKINKFQNILGNEEIKSKNNNSR